MKTKLFFLSTIFTTLLVAQTYIVNCPFENDVLGSYPNGWTIKYNGTGNVNQKVVDNPVKNGAKAFQMEGSYNWSSEFYQTPSVLPNLVTIEAWVNPEKILSGISGSIGLGNYTVGTWGTRTSRLQFFADRISTQYQGGLVYDIQSYTPGIWYHFKMEHDLTAKTYKVYINGSQVSGTNGSTTISEFPMHPTVASLHVMLLAGNSGTVKMFWDDVKVYDTSTLSIIDENQKGNNFFVCSNILYFKNQQDLSEISHIEVYNLLAQNVFNTSKITTQIPFKNLQKGVYILKIKSRNGKVSNLKFLIS